MEKRVVSDCRDYPSEKNCSLTIAGTEKEVLKVAVRHAIEDHGHKKSETAKIRKWVKKSLKKA
ncbi:MAG: DUF1059 domain-containing protein [Candidatus Micrarchaeaceae archaeon]|jgi:predicted transglutaminase-like cysteine proteinase